MGEIATVVVVGAVALFALVGVVSWLSSGSIYDQIGQGGLTAGSGPDRLGAPPPAGPPPGSAAERAEQELEIRQLVQARSERRVRKGEPALDVEAELEAELVRLGVSRDDAQPGEGAAGGSKRDAALAEEVRQLVVARNERRARRGEQPLDVEAEVARTLAELSP